MRVIALHNIKGGVGKTTAAVNLAWLSARSGQRTLLWDLDPQGAATFCFRIAAKVKGGARGIVRGKSELDGLIRESDHAGLDLLPADFSYRHLDLELDATEKSRGTLRRLLEPLQDSYDHVFLDCAPGITLVAEAVISAADVLLVPTIPTPLSLRTLAQLLKHVRSRKRRPRVLPFFSLTDRRKLIHRHTCDYARERDLGFLETSIPSSSVVEQMSVRRGPVGTYAPSSSAAKAYESMWAEVLAQLDGAPGPDHATKRSVHRLLEEVSQRASRKVKRAALEAGHTEVEYKLRVEGEESFVALTRELSGPDAQLPPAVRQANHLYDTPDRALAREGYILRLREAGGRNIVTVKGPAQPGGDSAVSAKREEETEVTDEVARGARNDGADLLQLVEERVGAAAADLSSDLRGIAGDRPLECLGTYVNHRRRLGPVQVGAADVELVFEFDTTEFPGGRVHHEVEVEVQGKDEAACRSALEELFLRVDLPWTASTSKSKRFFEALAGNEI